MVDLFVGWFVWFVSCLVSSLVDLFVGWIVCSWVGWLNGSDFGWIVCCFGWYGVWLDVVCCFVCCWFDDLFICCFVDLLICLFFGMPFLWLGCCYFMSDLLVGCWLNDWLIDFSTRRCIWLIYWMSWPGTLSWFSPQPAAEPLNLHLYSDV